MQLLRNNPFRFTLSYANKKDIICPSCKQKTFTPMLDLKTLLVNESYGICNRREKCGYKAFPQTTNTKERYLQNRTKTLPADNIQVWAIRKPFTENLTEQCFTQIEPYPKTNAIQRLSVQQLVTLINHLPATSEKKNQANILKGKYYNRTDGAFCVNPGNYLFFDLDVKANSWLLEPPAKKLVREILEEDALFVCDSWSKGLCGLLWVNDFNFTNDMKQSHKAIATEIYHLIAEYIELLTNIKPKFDLMQGAFRQVRFFCQQENKICLNMNPTKYYYSIGVYLEDFYCAKNNANT